jgi:hypothetical protein
VPQDTAGDGWVPDDRLWPELRAKLGALKLCRARCLAHAGTPDAAVIAAPVLKLLVTLLANLGSMRPDADDECVWRWRGGARADELVVPRCGRGCAFRRLCRCCASRRCRYMRA